MSHSLLAALCSCSYGLFMCSCVLMHIFLDTSWKCHDAILIDDNLYIHDAPWRKNAPLPSGSLSVKVCKSLPSVRVPCIILHRIIVLYLSTQMLHARNTANLYIDQNILFYSMLLAREFIAVLKYIRGTCDICLLTANWTKKRCLLICNISKFIRDSLVQLHDNSRIVQHQ